MEVQQKAHKVLTSTVAAVYLDLWLYGEPVAVWIDHERPREIDVDVH